MDRKSQQRGGGYQARQRAAAEARKRAYAEELAATCRRVDNGEPPLLLDALRDVYRPLVGGSVPYWRPPMPPCTSAVRVTSGFTWRRPYVGPVVVLDRTAAWMTAAASVNVAHGALEHTGDTVDDFARRPGFYRTQRFSWFETDLPDPLSHTGRDPEPWVTSARMELLGRLAREGRWPEAAVLDSWTGVPARLTAWAEYVNDVRGYVLDKYGRDTGHYHAVKQAFSQAVNAMRGKTEDAAGTRRIWPKTDVHRTDIAYAIQDHAAVCMFNVADECAKVDGRPVGIRAVDELLLPAEELATVQTVVRAGRSRPAVTLDQDGRRLGTFKVKGYEDWTG